MSEQENKEGIDKLVDAYERAVHDPLLASIAAGSNADRARPDHARPDSQVVCCIDVRSEGLRRHLEAVGNHEGSRKVVPRNRAVAL